MYGAGAEDKVKERLSATVFQGQSRRQSLSSEKGGGSIALA